MNYDIFDEQYYLASYPWLKPAIDAGIIKSGREHFEKFGQAGGLTAVSRYFDEQTYLAQNPDIVPSIRNSSNPNAPFASGLDHFIQFGYEEGRTRVSLDYDEAFYLKRYPVLARFVENGTFKSGFEHFVKFGSKEGLYANTFFEAQYLLQNPAVAAAVKAGDFKTGGEHYRKFGQFESVRPYATFFGTSGNDIVTGFGMGNVDIIGVALDVETNGNRRYQSYGSNEFDTLIGGSGRDNFVLAVTVPGIGGSRPAPVSVQFYQGPGFATIQNFTQGQDTILLGSTSFDKYILFPINNNRDLAIQTNGLPFYTPNEGNQLSYGDTIAVIEGGGNLSLNLLPDSNYFRTLIG
ncbi:calcium-binding protein [Microcoleus vaginatus DQ-U2]|uniref:calcium-binding protein n=1 Tax=Microcoleus vaginatus TaxID=119532 RepID=UPI00168299DB|nr:calcium-binding protein [Microcoleus sp. FACHB-DQ6]